MASPKTYSFLKVSAIYGGSIFTGFSPDGITIAFNSEHAVLSMGADGVGTRTMTNDYSARITFSLQAGSDNNLLMSGFANADRLEGVTALPLLIKDGNGTSVFAAKSAWIVTSPEVTLGSEIGTREWVLETDKLNYLTGGAQDI